MFAKFSRLILGFSIVLCFGQVVEAQSIPTPAVAQQMLRNDPSLLGRLQQMMTQSGLTADQVRARLRAQGYPESLLDQYLPGSRADSTTVPSDATFTALRALGVAESAVDDSLANTARS